VNGAGKAVAPHRTHKGRKLAAADAQYLRWIVAGAVAYREPFKMKLMRRALGAPRISMPSSLAVYRSRQASIDRRIDLAVEKALRRREKDWPLVVRSV
jgi:hypothetical protein